MKVCAMVLGFLLAGATYGEDTWQQITDQATAAGLNGQRFEELLARCRDAGLSPATARTITHGLLRACTNQLPTDSVYAKLDEGLTKHAGVEQISHAVEIRVDMLERADALMNAHRGQDQRGRPALIGATAQALESGVPESGIARLLADPSAGRPGRLMGAIEGLEALHAQGVPRADAERLMVDALKQGLRRNEMLQAVDRALRQQQETSRATGIAPKHD